MRVLRSTHCLGHRQGTGAQAEADSLDAEVLVVAAAAVNVLVGSVVQVGRVQRLPAVCAREAPLVPDPVLADHLLGSVHRKSASQASALALAPQSVQRTTVGAKGEAQGIKLSVY